MFNNIGKKIQTLAQVVCWIGIVGSVIAGLGVCAMDDGMVIYGLLTAVGGAFVSWIGSFFVYGFGELIVKTTEIAENTRRNAPAAPFFANTVPQSSNNNVNNVNNIHPLPPQN